MSRSVRFFGCSFLADMLKEVVVDEIDLIERGFEMSRRVNGRRVEGR